MLKFVAATEAANDGGMKFVKPPADTSLSGQELGTLTHMVINRFIESVNWEDVVSIYLGGLVDEDDKALIQRAVRVLMDGGIEFNV